MLANDQPPHMLPRQWLHLITWGWREGQGSVVGDEHPVVAPYVMLITPMWLWF